jgi:hypothetical protein
MTRRVLNGFVTTDSALIGAIQGIIHNTGACLEGVTGLKNVDG